MTVNAVSPRFIDTEFHGELSRETRDTIVAQVPVGRAGTPADVASAVRWLASPEASYVTGQVIHVNGSWSSPVDFPRPPLQPLFAIPHAVSFSPSPNRTAAAAGSGLPRPLPRRGVEDGYPLTGRANRELRLRQFDVQGGSDGEAPP